MSAQEPVAVEGAIRGQIRAEVAAAMRTVSVPGALKLSWPRYLSVAADIATLAVVFFLANRSPDFMLRLVLLVLTLICFFFILLYIWQQVRYSRRGRYAEALPVVHVAIHRLRDMHRRADKLGIRDLKAELSSCLTGMASAFSLVTGARCRMCIKTLEQPSARPDNLDELDGETRERILAELFSTVTFCRDQDSYQYHAWNEQPAPIAKNSSFSFLFTGGPSPKNRRFFCNDLVKRYPDYDNTSFEVYGYPERRWPAFLRRWRWTLPYRSCIVWPIRALTPEGKSRPDQAQEWQDIVGFLAVDSYGRNVFHGRYDHEMGAILADALFVFLRDVQATEAKGKLGDADSGGGRGDSVADGKG